MGKTYEVGITIRSAPGVPEDVRRAVRELVRWLRVMLKIRHGVIVVVRPEPAVGAHGGVGFAAFEWRKVPPSKGGFVWILLGEAVADTAVDEWDLTREDGLHIVRENLLHEFVHYEQWRDGRKPTERGVNLRARNLLRRFYDDTAARLAPPQRAAAGWVRPGGA